MLNILLCYQDMLVILCYSSMLNMLLCFMLDVLLCCQDVVVSRVRHIKTSDIVQLARDGRIRTDACQFSCQRCDHVWWRRIPDRKRVSHGYNIVLRYTQYCIYHIMVWYAHVIWYT